jgi:hypothetical protein
MAKHDLEEGILRRQKLNVHTVAILITLGLGSMSYGYTASIIATTLGGCHQPLPVLT